MKKIMFIFLAAFLLTGCTVSERVCDHERINGKVISVSQEIRSEYNWFLESYKTYSVTTAIIDYEDGSRDSVENDTLIVGDDFYKNKEINCKYVEKEL